MAIGDTTYVDGVREQLLAGRARLTDVLGQSQSEQMVRLLEALEELDDVQNVHSNFDMDAEQMEHAAG